MVSGWSQERSINAPKVNETISANDMPLFSPLFLPTNNKTLYIYGSEHSELKWSTAHTYCALGGQKVEEIWGGEAAKGYYRMKTPPKFD